MADSSAQTQKSGPDRYAELQSMLRNREAEIVALQLKFETIVDSHASKVQRLFEKIAKLAERSSTVPPTKCGTGEEEPPYKGGHLAQIRQTRR
ncbi:hypothetical protein MTO96_035239 [Rhipicephalus appendiculatus]